MLFLYPFTVEGQVNRPVTQKEKLQSALTDYYQELAQAQAFIAQYGLPSSCLLDGVQMGDVIGVDAQGVPVCSRPFATFNTSFDVEASQASVTSLWGMEASFVDYLWPQRGYGYGLTGDGVTLGSLEVARCTHQEFTERGASRILQLAEIPDPCGTQVSRSTRNHGTHVAGRMVSAGAVNPNSVGAAYRAQLRPHQTFTAHALAGVPVANSSVTGPGGSDHTAYAAPYFLGVQAAGNACFQTCIGVYGGINNEGGAPVTKNFLTVGSARGITGRQRYQTPNDVVLNTLTSWGPTTDGRIKPDLVAVNRDDQLNALKSPSGATDYAYSSNFTGTSASAPLVAGALGLLVEYHHDLYGLTADSLFSSTYKALAIHAASEAGKHPGPDYRHGWGLFNAFGAAQVMKVDYLAGGRRHLVEDPLSNGATQVYVLISKGDAPLRITLAWTDPYVYPFALQNDLDVRLIAPNGTVHLPWTLNPDDPEAPAIPNNNTTDNVEQILIAQPMIGTYQIEVSHKNTLVNDEGQPAPQWYSLVASHWDLMNPCMNHWTLNNLTIAEPRVYETLSAIQTEADVQLLTGAQVELSAGTAVNLGPGFYAGAGSQMHASIAGCAPAIPYQSAETYQGVDEQMLGQVSKEGNKSGAKSIQLEQNYPNPFAIRTRIEFRQAEDAKVLLEVYNMLGQRVRTLRDHYLSAGIHSVEWDGKNQTGRLLPNGSYLYRLQIGNQVHTRRMILLK